jgi:hypothetical protein
MLDEDGLRGGEPGEMLVAPQTRGEIAYCVLLTHGGCEMRRDNDTKQSRTTSVRISVAVIATLV